MLAEYRQKFEEAICDDLNVPLALGILWTMLRLDKSRDVYDLALTFDKVFGLNLDKIKQEKVQIEVPQQVLALAETRKMARQSKNWAESDRLRDEIAALGYAIKDTANGYEIELKK